MSLSTIQSQLNLYEYTIFSILGNIGNVFIVILFSRQHQNPCSIYLICSAIMNSVFLTFDSFVQIFPFYYADQTIRAFALCKLNSFIPIFSGQVAKTMLVLACIDRFMITSNRATFRAFSTVKRAKWLIFFSIIFWALFTIHIPIMQTIVNGQCGMSGIYSKIFTVYTIVFTALIPPILLCIFGYLSYRNMRQMYARVQPVVCNTTDGNISTQRRNRDLLIIVISEIFVYLVTAAAFPVILLERMISQYIIPNKTIQYSQIEVFIINIALFLLFINSAAPFYTYLIASKSFRRDFKKLIINTYQKLTRQPTILTVPRAQQTLSQRDTRV